MNRKPDKIDRELDREVAKFERAAYRPGVDISGTGKVREPRPRDGNQGGAVRGVKSC